MPKHLNDRIAALKAKKDELAARLNTLEAKAKGENRKRDTKRKIIVGGVILLAMDKDPVLAARVRQLLAANVGRQSDKDAIADLLTATPTPLQSETTPDHLAGGKPDF